MAIFIGRTRTAKMRNKNGNVIERPVPRQVIRMSASKSVSYTHLKAQVSASKAAIEAARTNSIQAQTRVEAAQATERRIAADIDDSELKAPRDGRVQYRVAEPGEVLAAGGRVLNMVDLSDVYMTCLLYTSHRKYVFQTCVIYFVTNKSKISRVIYESI